MAQAQNKAQDKSQNQSQNKSGGGQGKGESHSHSDSAGRGQTRALGKPQTEKLPLNKWTGCLELVSGLGFGHLPDEVSDADPMPHLLEQVKFNICRATSTFFFSTQAQGFFEKNETYTQRATMRGKDRAEILGREGKFNNPGFSLRSDFDWHPTTSQQISAYFSYGYDYDKTKNNSVNLFTDAKDLFNVKVALENSRIHQHAAEAGWESSHHLGSSRRQLLTSGAWKGSFNNQTSRWMKLMMSHDDGTASDDSRSSLYRLDSRMNEQEGTLSVSYRDSLIKSEHNLTIEPGVKVRLAGTWNDNSGAVNVDESSWRDSIGIHEDFDFTTVQLEPRLQLEYQYSSLRLLADYSLQFYGRNLSSQLREQSMKWLPTAVIGHTSVEWTPGTGHLLTLGSSLSVMQPDYQQLCWYRWQGADPTELIQGNPDLLPSRSVSTDLTWRFKKGPFSLAIGNTYDYRTREFEEVFNTQMIDGQEYSIYTWINTDYTHSISQNLQLGWKGKTFSANMRALYQHNWMNNPNADELVSSKNWEVRADFTVKPFDGWALSANGYYRSNINTLYKKNKDRYSLSARITKEFKRLSVYLEGRDLLDHAVTTENLSEDMSRQMVQTIHMNRRLFLLGLTIKF